jgi:hypothetical protein
MFFRRKKLDNRVIVYNQTEYCLRTSGFCRFIKNLITQILQKGQAYFTRKGSLPLPLHSGYGRAENKPCKENPY